MIQEKEKIKSPILCFLEIILIYICMYVCLLQDISVSGLRKSPRLKHDNTIKRKISKHP